MDNEEIKNMLLNQGKAFAEFKKANDERLKNLEMNVSVFAKKTGQRQTRSSKRIPLNNN
ncbi:hypothetical protein SAMN05216404_11926 [Nitrosospira multiformis]|uniref:Uncharacterized protein n=1 Tax=Nitrosospira multiformis TaxID=1231 RepID=A0A1H8P650_9PROT|nr:hypothetical protein [Nitrosospira multiformis]SEO37271.1 hypothetical protein SAMN05216404_11926 [Nitrosospira multiformis]